MGYPSMMQKFINKWLWKDIFLFNKLSLLFFLSFLFWVIFFSGCCCCGLLYFMATAHKHRFSKWESIPFPSLSHSVLFSALILSAHKRFLAFVFVFSSPFHWYHFKRFQVLSITGAFTILTWQCIFTRFIPAPPYPSVYKEASPFCILFISEPFSS